MQQILSNNAQNSQTKVIDNSQTLAKQLFWLLDKKKIHFSELQKFQQQIEENLKQIITKNEELTKQKDHLKQQLTSLQKSLQNSQESNNKEKQNLQSIISKVKKENLDLSSQLEEKNAQIKEKNRQIIEKNYVIQSLQNEIKIQMQKISEVQENSLKKQQLLQIQNNENIKRMIEKYENLIEQKLQTLKKQYENDLAQQKQRNKTILFEMQKKFKQTEQKQKQQKLKENNDENRLLSQNKKLLSSLNISKTKILSLELEIQELKAQKQSIEKRYKMELQICNKKLSILQEDRQKFSKNIKQLQEERQEILWQLTKQKSQRQQIQTKLKQKFNEQMQQKQIKFVQKVQNLEQKNTKLKEQISSIEKNYEEIYKQRNSLKEIVQYLKKQIQILKNQINEKQNQKGNTKGNEKESFGEKSFQKQNNKVKDQTQGELIQLRNLVPNLKKEIIRKNAQIQVFQEEISRLKSKCNKLSIALQQNLKMQEEVEKQNKMLLSEIVFLRDKNKSKIATKDQGGRKGSPSRRNHNVLDMDSEQSIMSDNFYQEQIQKYKAALVDMQKMMTEQMGLVADKLAEKNSIIQKQKAIIQRLQRQLMN